MKSKSRIFSILLSIVSLGLAGMAAFFSIYGLYSLYVSVGILVLASTLEFAKLVWVSFLYWYWDSIKKKWWSKYAVAFTILVMVVTSLGNYGYLTSSYQKNSNKMAIKDSRINIIENKKKVFESQLVRVNGAIESDNNRIKTITGVRDQQEKRISSLYEQKYVSGAKRTETLINSSDEQIKILNSDITKKMEETTQVNDSISKYDNMLVELRGMNISDEVSTYQYIAKITGMSMDRIINILTLILIFVFDPMAVVSMIAFNFIIKSEIERTAETTDSEKLPEPESEPESEPVEPKPVETVPAQEPVVESIKIVEQNYILVPQTDPLYDAIEALEIEPTAYLETEPTAFYLKVKDVDQQLEFDFDSVQDEILPVSPEEVSPEEDVNYIAQVNDFLDIFEIPDIHTPYIRQEVPIKNDDENIENIENIEAT